MESLIFYALIAVPELKTVLMVVAPIVAVGLGLLVGGASGSFNSVLGWLRGTEPFNARKQVVAIIEGFLAGVFAAWLEVQKFGADPIDDYVFALSVISIFIMTGGLQNYVSKGVGALETRIMTKEEGTTTTPS